MANTHVVQAGECLYQIAKRYGFGDWKAIYEHPENAAFRKKRGNPNVIFPGDRIHIPDREERKVEAATGSSHTFKVNRARMMLRLAIRDEAGAAVAARSTS